MENTPQELKTPYQADMDTKAEPSLEEVNTGDLVAYSGVDPSLAAKMHIVNDVRLLFTLLKNGDLQPVRLSIKLDLQITI